MDTFPVVLVDVLRSNIPNPCLELFVPQDECKIFLEKAVTFPQMTFPLRM